jgi:hypothetical protein
VASEGRENPRLDSVVREHYDRSHDNAKAVLEGLASTARVITAAALIMAFTAPAADPAQAGVGTGARFSGDAQKPVGSCSDPRRPER